MAGHVFVTGEAAMLSGRTLVVSDLHIGIEHEARVSGINLPSQSGEMLARIERIAKDNNVKRIIILGDVKHRVPGTSFQEEREIPEFFSGLSSYDVEIVPGNHDPGIGRLVPDSVSVRNPKGFLDGEYFFCHGHAKPDISFLKARYVVMGHTQPLIEFSDSLGYRWTERVWCIAPFSERMLRKEYGSSGPSELVIVPAFNRFSGGFPLNRKEKPDRKREFASPLTKLCNMKKAKIYLLDGTFLGELGNLGK